MQLGSRLRLMEEDTGKEMVENMSPAAESCFLAEIVNSDPVNVHVTCFAPKPGRGAV